LKIRWVFLKLCGTVHRRPYKGFLKIPPIYYQFKLLITGIKRNPNLAGDGEMVVESVFFKPSLFSEAQLSHTYI
jgi:hypothetical protein